MTETTAAATMSCATAEQSDWAPARRHAAAANCGKTVFGIDIKIVGEDGEHCRATASRRRTHGARTVDSQRLL